MNDIKKKNSSAKVNKNPWWLRWCLLLVAVLLTGGLIWHWAMELAYAGRIAYGVKINDYVVGGFTYEDLDQYFEKQTKKLAEGVDLVEGERIIGHYRPDQMGVWVNLKGCKQKILDYARDEDYFTRQGNRLLAIAGKANFECEVWVDDFDYSFWVAELRKTENKPAVSSSIEKKDGRLEMLPASDGEVVDEVDLKKQVLEVFGDFSLSEIIIKKVVQKPQVTEEMAMQTKKLADDFGQKEQLKLKYKDWTLVVLPDELFDWMLFELRKKDTEVKDSEYISNSNQERYVISFDLNKVDKFLNQTAYEFEQRPINAKLKMTPEGVRMVDEGKDGNMVNRVKLIKMLEDLIGTDQREIELPMETSGALVTKDNIDKLGIKELIGSGTSDFSWSPGNRIHNIEVGAGKFDGTVIAPGEEFSFTSRLGMVNADTGFLPELVIADNETRPEYGGGLCQVSTTMFRVAINSGLPITERHPHQYRVSYYEPAGMDATIYIPSPDLKFVNDTGNYIMIEAVVDGVNLTFNFYGTSDGRKVEVTEPDIFNITSPPAPVYIETDGLAAGETWQVDSAHYGADAIFYRTITDKSGKSNKEEFSSHYAAWPAKFKVGRGEVKKEEKNNEQLPTNGDNTGNAVEVDASKPAGI